jgi:hypothetical protein
MRRFLPLFVLALLASPCFAEPSKPLIVHEWGTFTSLQDETGRAIGYLNSSDEPLPFFVHRLRSAFIRGGGGFDLSKSLPPAHADVTMRLETPVIYFHPADKTPFNVDVLATFKGGVLSEYYPDAKVQIEGGDPAPAGLNRISSRTQGGLQWKSLRIGGEVTLSETKDHVWIAPRQVDSAPVSAGKEGERYVFYRGVGKVDSPLTVTRSSDTISISGPAASPSRGFAQGQGPSQPRWLAEFRADGTCAFRTITDQTEAKAVFTDEDFSKGRVADLRKEMRRALIADGLFEDEAEAMLNTWQRSYFQGVGQRVFFMVPREWTDSVLPLTLSVPCELTRVMIGRVELVTPKQRDTLAKLATDPKLYASLGRFGYAMVLDELKQRPTPALEKFAKQYDIRPFTPSPAATQPVARVDVK